MDRDSVFGERVIFRAKALHIEPTPAQRAAFWGLVLLAAIATAMSVAVASTIHVAASGLIFFAAWCATVAMALRVVPRLWHLGAEYVVTEKHVVWKRGAYRRSIERSGITYARIHWYRGQRVAGDLELVRDIPTGALRRRLTIVFRGVTHPDRLLDIIRNAVDETHADALESLELPLGQRLEPGERVIWSGRPIRTWRRFLPTNTRDLAGAALGVTTTILLGKALVRATGALQHVLEGGIPAKSVGFVSLAAGLGLTAALLTGIAIALVWTSGIRQGLLTRRTSYLITNRRVLIAQGDEELHLDREHIVDVVEARADAGHDLFLILDGPGSRAVALSGAFDGDGGRGLAPVLRKIADADEAGRILKRRVPSLAA